MWPFTPTCNVYGCVEKTSELLMVKKPREDQTVKGAMLTGADPLSNIPVSAVLGVAFKSTYPLTVCPPSILVVSKTTLVGVSGTSVTGVEQVDPSTGLVAKIVMSVLVDARLWVMLKVAEVDPARTLTVAGVFALVGSDDVRLKVTSSSNGPERATFPVSAFVEPLITELEEGISVSVTRAMPVMPVGDPAIFVTTPGAETASTLGVSVPRGK